MTIAELSRSIDSKKRVKKIEAQEKASFDYTLADLIGRSISRLYSSAHRLPEIHEAYPTIFDSEEVKQKKAEQQMQLSALRFKQFATSFNNRLRGSKDK